MKDLKFIPGISPKQAYEMNFTAFPKDDNRFVRSWFHLMDRDYIAEYKNGLLSVNTRSIDTCFGRMIHAAVSINMDNLGAFGMFAQETKLTWSDLQIVKDNVIDYDRFAVEVYPKEKYLVDMTNVYHLFAFDDLCKNPFNIKKKLHELDEEVILPNAKLNGWTENSYSANSYSDTKVFPYKIDDRTYIVSKEYKFEGNPNDPNMQQLSILTSVTVYVGLITVTIKNKELKVYHVIIQPKNGYEDMITWNAKYMIKTMLFGKDCAGVEIYPTDRDFVDDGHYHMFIFDEEVDIPFGIHPDEVKYMKPVNRGIYMLNQAELIELQEVMKRHNKTSQN